ncbi:hypothetical protein EZV62_003320 [Acer yangbiense]|uniref:DUF4220 domain-containing protein n=1 Tax=Acer yangbiense TaxID=1000413 RepID=A0A5C7IH62_9ROSI|nr:hypothetical protein EZV62_003320 [Acer yangbiense]
MVFLPTSTQADSALQIFWAPFLLLHLGGPDTITAYSLEDNELWLRHLLGLVVHIGVAFYVFLRSWGNSALTLIAIPIFITGIIKYGERTFVLRSSSAQRFKNSLLSNPDPGPNIIQMERTEERRKRSLVRRMVESRCFNIFSMREFVVDVKFTSARPEMATVLETERLETGANDLQVAYFLFQRFQYLFADSILGTRERKDSCSKIENKSSEDAFKLIAIELGFMYDLLYTKATIVYSPLGILFRFISFIASVTALVLFSVIIDIHAYSSIDVYITYVLLIGAVVLEVYAFCVLLFSDWTALWYAGLRKTNRSSMFCATFPCHSILANRKRWSRSMAQYNLVSSCLQQQRWFGVQRLPWIGDLLEKYQCLSWEDVDKDIEKMIFRQLVEKSNEIKDDHFNIESCRILLAKRGDYVLEKRYGLHDQFCWSTTKVEFDHSLLLWHIATDLCYYSDLDDIHGGDVHKLDSKCRNSKCLSDYILYLLVFNPLMLPEGIGEIRYKDTFAEALRFFLLAQQLKSLEIDNHPNKWEVISEVWVEMLTYASNKCRWKEHGQQLRKGGELLTHVCLLMVHLGLSEQYRIQKIKFDEEYLRVADLAKSTFSPRSPPPLSLSSTEYLQLRTADLAKQTILASGFRLRQWRVQVLDEERRRFDCIGSLRKGQRRCGGLGRMGQGAVEFLNRENMQVIVSGILRVQNREGSMIFKDGGWIHNIVMSLRK